MAGTLAPAAEAGLCQDATIAGFADCQFRTDRLEAREWHRGARRLGRGLCGVVIDLLTPRVLEPLPAPWHGGYDARRADRWIAERDRDGATLLVTELATNEPLGLVVLGIVGDAAADGQLRLGYLLAEGSWGQGYGSELVAGLIGWCDRHTTIGSIVGGVARENRASARILEKNGFRLVPGSDSGAECLYQLDLATRRPRGRM